MMHLFRNQINKAKTSKLSCKNNVKYSSHTIFIAYSESFLHIVNLMLVKYLKDGFNTQGNCFPLWPFATEDQKSAELSMLIWRLITRFIVISMIYIYTYFMFYFQLSNLSLKWPLTNKTFGKYIYSSCIAP